MIEHQSDDKTFPGSALNELSQDGEEERQEQGLMFLSAKHRNFNDRRPVRSE